MPDTGNQICSVADEIVQAVSELPDRSSPDDWPEAMIVTSDELRDIVIRSYDASKDTEHDA